MLSDKIKLPAVWQYDTFLHMQGQRAAALIRIAYTQSIFEYRAGDVETPLFRRAMLYGKFATATT